MYTNIYKYIQIYTRYIQRYTRDIQNTRRRRPGPAPRRHGEADCKVSNSGDKLRSTPPIRQNKTRQQSTSHLVLCLYIHIKMSNAHT